MKFLEPLPALLACVRRLANLRKPDGATQAAFTDGDATDLTVDDMEEEDGPGASCSALLAAGFEKLKTRLLECEVGAISHPGLKRPGSAPLCRAFLCQPALWLPLFES